MTHKFLRKCKKMRQQLKKTEKNIKWRGVEALNEGWGNLVTSNMHISLVSSSNVRVSALRLVRCGLDPRQDHNKSWWVELITGTLTLNARQAQQKLVELARCRLAVGKTPVWKRGFVSSASVSTDCGVVGMLPLFDFYRDLSYCGVNIPKGPQGRRTALWVSPPLHLLLHSCECIWEATHCALCLCVSQVILK